MNKIITTKNLVKKFEEGRVKSLNGVNLEVRERECITIMGPSGSGKTTLLNVLRFLDRPASGKVIVDDTDLLNEKNLEEFRAKKIDTCKLHLSNKRRKNFGVSGNG